MSQSTPINKIKGRPSIRSTPDQNMSLNNSTDKSHQANNEVNHTRKSSLSRSGLELSQNRNNSKNESDISDDLSPRSGSDEDSSPENVRYGSSDEDKRHSESQNRRNKEKNKYKNRNIDKECANINIINIHKQTKNPPNFEYYIIAIIIGNAQFWSVVYSGLHNVIDRNSKFKATVFLFLHPKDINNASINLSREIAKIAARSLGTSGPIFVTEQDINNLPNERGYFIEQYRSDLEKQKVLVLPDLHKIPPHIAESLHFVCDVENPLVQKSIIILTMEITNINLKVPPLRQIENILQGLWSPPLSDNKIEPIITRLTTSVSMITPEIVYYGKSN
ncbi:uncharacterized protein LOC113370551 isoform X1 [Ctenocephalides felis]|uniref:uncharacterized protein LOC113370551 isoform X1 n=1 Tax=Ctenocephalides felis TaxID=7515 RepID=UPI000E6E10A8|nr:uncharacterized protein LOC113370551 isoform X1 [Ctenocephalides felis]